MTEEEAEAWAIEHLAKFFVVESIPEIIRRPVPAFGGVGSIGWIAAGFGEKVIEIYDKATRYQE